MNYEYSSKAVRSTTGAPIEHIISCLERSLLDRVVRKFCKG